MLDHLPWNEIVHGDMLEGLRMMPDKSIELGFADPPFNIDLKDNVNNGKCFHERSGSKVSYYHDIMTPEEYASWCSSWLKEMKRVCAKVLVYCGGKNVTLFHRIDEPLDVIMYFMPFNTVITPAAWASRYRPILVYTDDKNTFLGRPSGKNRKFNSSVIVKEKKWFDDREEKDRKKLIHPCPIDRELINEILVQLKPVSFLDAFVGSGTVVMIATELGIPWIGFESNDAYKPDHDYLLATARDRSSKNDITRQESLLSFL